MEREWVLGGPLSTLAMGAARVIRQGARSAVLFRLEDGSLRAIDNRCPHEGYPLSQGTLCGAVLTCCYHNFKFNLDDGRCLVGDEGATVYPVRLEEDVVWVDMSPPDHVDERPKRWNSLHEAVSEARIGQVARDVVRLLSLGVSPAEIASDAAAWDAEHAQYGCSHALPVAAVAVSLAERLPGLSCALALVPAYELAAETSARRLPHPVVAPVGVGSQEALLSSLREAIEREDPQRTEAIIRGAVAELGFAALEEPLLRIVSDHLSDYGHGLIYTVKTFELLRSNDAMADTILAGLGRTLVFATREDLVPGWRPFHSRMAELGESIYPFMRNTDRTLDRELTVSRLLGATPSESAELVFELLEAGNAAVAVLDALSIASAQRLLRFDLAIDADASVQDAWLDVTHLLTFADAVRCAFQRSCHGELIRYLFQLARLVARTAPLDADEPEIPPLLGSLDQLLEAIVKQDTRRAVALALGIDRRESFWPILELVLDDLVVRPIFHAHAIKLPIAAAAESEATSDARPFAAAVRFLASPRNERRTAARVREAMTLVAEGRPPRLLAH